MLKAKSSSIYFFIYTQLCPKIQIYHRFLKKKIKISHSCLDSNDTNTTIMYQKISGISMNEFKVRLKYRCLSIFRFLLLKKQKTQLAFAPFIVFFVFLFYFILFYFTILKNVNPASNNAEKLLCISLCDCSYLQKHLISKYEISLRHKISLLVAVTWRLFHQSKPWRGSNWEGQR